MMKLLSGAEPPKHTDYDDAFSALEKSLMFIEEQQGVAAHDILILRKWRNFSTERRIDAKKKQTFVK